VLLPEEAAPTFEQLFLPLRDLGWVDLILASQLAERLLFFGWLKRNPKLELCIPALPLFRYDRRSSSIATSCKTSG